MGFYRGFYGYVNVSIYLCFLVRIIEIILPTVGKIDAPDRVPMGTPESTGRHPISGTPNGDSHVMYDIF